MSNRTIVFALSLNPVQFAAFIEALKPLAPPVGRIESFIKRKSSISRTALMRHGGFRAHEIDLCLAAHKDDIKIDNSGRIPVYIWKQSESTK
jgi:hypothetical protein